MYRFSTCWTTWPKVHAKPVFFNTGTTAYGLGLVHAKPAPDLAKGWIPLFPVGASSVGRREQSLAQDRITKARKCETTKCESGPLTLYPFVLSYFRDTLQKWSPF